jgi:uncharacterized membrane protein YjjB (DUF3815 family)
VVSKPYPPSDAMLPLIQRTFRLLAPEEKRKTLALCVAVVASAVVEVLSVTAIMPFMAVILASDGGRSLRVVQWLHQLIGPTNDTQFTLVVGLISVGLLLASSLLSLVTRHTLLEFSYNRYPSATGTAFCQLLN